MLLISDIQGRTAGLYNQWHRSDASADMSTSLVVSPNGQADRAFFTAPGAFLCMDSTLP